MLWSGDLVEGGFLVEPLTVILAPKELWEPRLFDERTLMLVARSTEPISAEEVQNLND